MNKNERKQRRHEARLARNERKKSGSVISRMVSFSLILHLLDLLTNAVYRCLSCGLFGRAFTSYSSEQTAFEKGAVRGYFTERGSDIFRRIRARLSNAFERSYLLDKFGRFIKKLMEVPIRLYGNLFLSFGIYSVMIYFIEQIMTDFGDWDSGAVAVRIVLIVISLPMHMSSESLGHALSRGALTRAIFIDALGFTEEDLDLPAKRTRRKANYVVMVGMAAGLVTFFIEPLELIIAASIVILSLLIIASPEIGVMLSIFMIPFYSFFDLPSLLLAALVLLSTAGYAIKLVRGKRIFKLEIVDVFIIIFAVLMLMSGIISAGGVASFTSSILCCALLLGYFLFVNLMRTEAWIDRCVSALVSSGVITAAFGVLQYLSGNMSTDWLDTLYFTDIEGRVVSFFDNPNVLSAYLVIVFPFLLYKLFRAKTARGGLLAFLGAVTVITCVMMTYSRAAWLAMIAVVLLYGLINSRKTLKACLCFGFAIPFLPYVLPSSVVNRFMSIGDISETSNFYRVYTWRGTLSAIKDNFWGGVGFGTEAYSEIYPMYAYAGIEAAEHSHNLYLQILFGMGIFGLLIFAAVVFFFAQKNFEFYKHTKKSDLRVTASAAFVSVVGALVIGLFDYPWYNYRVFFLFWIAMAISCACIRCGDREARKEKMVNTSSSDKASIDI